ncbi:MAG: 50S ribosomal protein L29 [Candidatus Levybacteria bacterium RIFCSPLOWO2_01_FULL_39_24]|nr:MAG: 50S ribosomal protein L29 [Candidatus Levybacteria bacterium RIFCSPHIGHO2_01_FULL_40_16]OGH28553.1 MAG: 50S ribosomal protein L29 [Candidatus Levybacteria bacterium RIFCSPHIGHO2_12_FULL_39_9]OGH45941.1 MAG: 50S ribosomal protein L29 [Candidatus Levybacteria bacterium RIFCSPLOWO2_01_FULL_39_24]
MKSKDRKELHLKSIKDLRNLVAEAKDALVGLRLDKTQNKLKNTSLLVVKRKEIAQMLTIIRLKELSEIQAKKK